jgi:hypothetical protein
MALYYGILSTLLMIASVLCGFGEASLDMAFYRVLRNINQLRELGTMSAFEGQLSKALNRLRNLEAKQRALKTARWGALGTSLLARVLMIEALLIDTEVAADGVGGLETVFGG